MERREFLKQGLKAGLTATVGGPLLREFVRTPLAAEAKNGPDVAVVWGDDYGKNALKAVDLVGGIGRFVPKDSRVAILANVQSSHPGTFTSPAVLRAAIQLCRQAGAREINLVSWQALKNWESTGLAKVADEEGASLKLVERDEANFKPVPVPSGKTLTEADVDELFRIED